MLRPPSSLTGALEFLSRILASPSVRVIGPGAEFPARFDRICREADAKGNLVFDALIAAVCEEHGADEILTADRDFGRFSRLKPQWLSSPD